MKLELITHEPEIKLNSKHILFIHGTWHAAWCWDKYFLPYFSNQGYFAHALSLRGHGKSEGIKQLRKHSINDFINDVEQVVKGIPGYPILVGHSMGGYILQKYLEKNISPAAVLLNSLPTYGAISTISKLLLRHPLQVLRCITTFSLYPIVSKPDYIHKVFFSDCMTKEEINEYHSLISDDSFRALFDMLFNLPHPKKVKAKNILFLGGENDKMIYPIEVKITAKKFGADFKIFPDIAHDMMLEHNWKQVADYIINWLKKINL